MQAAQASGKTEEVAKLKAEFDKVEAEASQFVKRNELSKIVEQAGGVGLNPLLPPTPQCIFTAFQLIS